MMLVNDIGPQLSGDERSPVLKMGITLAIRQSSGIKPDDKHWVKRADKIRWMP